jgi:NADPH-dependent ferric siderophore reductase
METTQPVPIAVTFSQELTPRTRRITFEGPITVDTTNPASYLSLYFTDPGPDWPSNDGDPPASKRTYTPRYLRPECGSMTIDFVLHGEGRATEWAQTARAGDVIWAGAVTGGYDIPDDLDHLVLIGDDTAIPAIGTVVEAIPHGTRTTVIIEVIDEDDERDPSESVSCDPIWLHRGTDVTDVGDQMLNLARSISVPRSSHWWLAGEREAIRSVRDLLVEARHIPRNRIAAAAYWRIIPLDPRMR